MKPPAIVILLLAAASAFSQSGNISIKAANDEGKDIIIYEPPTGLYLPEVVLVNVSCSEFRLRSVPLNKRESGYEFSLKIPDSVNLLFLTISDTKQNTLDDNAGKGFLVYLRDPADLDPEKTLFEKTETLALTYQALKLDYTVEEIIDQYESLYATYPHLKYDSRYMIYLFMKFSNDKEGTRSELFAFADEMALQEDENSLYAAYFIYMRLGLTDEKEKVEKITIEKFPQGEIARHQFYIDYAEVEERTETYTLANIDEYIQKFGDTLDAVLRFLYTELLNQYLDDKDTINLAKYEDNISDKLFIAGIYNNKAWELAGEDLTIPGKELEFAEQLSGKSLFYIKNRMNNPEDDYDLYQLERSFQMYLDTYALIMYKQKKYDLAYQYQHELVLALGDEMGMDGKERYAAYAEKAKGLEYAKDYLENQLLNGADSQAMINQLLDIYSKLNLPEDQLEIVKIQYLDLAAQNEKDKIIAKYGDIKAIDFTLTNLEGEEVTLSDHQGKVVILDFWAIWCGPCIGSFPEMQELVSKFKNESVEFFFINSWESDEPDEIKKKVIQFLEKNNYSFNVLFDFDDDVINRYKVMGIPETILIDKGGNIKSIVRYDDDLAAMISENL